MGRRYVAALLRDSDESAVVQPPGDIIAKVVTIQYATLAFPGEQAGASEPSEQPRVTSDACNGVGAVEQAGVQDIGRREEVERIEARGADILPPVVQPPS